MLGDLRETRTNGIGPPKDVTVVLDEDEAGDLTKNEIWTLVTREARAVSVWALLAPIIRIVQSLLVHVSQDCVAEETCKADSFSVPGFVFASAWLLFMVRDNFDVIPNVPLRICETVMGRMTLQDLCVILPVHFLCTLSTFMILNLLLPSSMASIALSPITFSKDTAWFMDFVREVAVNCAFTVSFLVLPEIFALNKVPRFFTAIVMYPLYSFAVDANGKGSVFAPNVLYALNSIGRTETLGRTTFIRCAGDMLGGFLGGNIMRRHFPDDVRTTRGGRQSR